MRSVGSAWKTTRSEISHQSSSVVGSGGFKQLRDDFKKQLSQIEISGNLNKVWLDRQQLRKILLRLGFIQQKSQPSVYQEIEDIYVLTKQANKILA
jgi:Zn-finger nucleic acid-binding protein